MFEDLRKLAQVMGIEPGTRPWKEVVAEMIETYECLKASYDSFMAYDDNLYYDDYIDEYPEEEYYDGYDYDPEPDYWYEEGLDYLQGSQE